MLSAEIQVKCTTYCINNLQDFIMHRTKNCLVICIIYLQRSMSMDMIVCVLVLMMHLLCSKGQGKSFTTSQIYSVYQQQLLAFTHSHPSKNGVFLKQIYLQIVNNSLIVMKYVFMLSYYI